MILALMISDHLPLGSASMLPREQNGVVDAELTVLL
jgi:hypothetical protein